MTSFLFVVKIPVHEDERPSKSASEEKSDDDSSEKETKNEDDKSNEKLDVTDDEEHADLDSDNLTKTEKVKEDELKEQKPKVEETQDDDDWDFGDEDTNKELGDTTGAQGKTSDNEDVTQKQEKDKILCENEGGKAESTNKADPGQSSNGNETLDQNKTVTEENTTQNVSFADVLKAAISRENNNEEKDSEQIPLNPEQQCEATVQNNTDISAAEAVGSNDSKTENNNIEKEKELLEEKSVEPHENGDVNKGEGGEDGEQSTAPPKKKFQVEKAAEDSLQLDEALSRQNQIEDTVKHLEKSESVPPLRLHEKLPVPASLSDDRLSEVENVNFQTVSFLDEEPLVETVKAIVESFSIDNFSVQKTENGEFYQVIFLDEGGERCESILNQLAKQKIGDRPGTSVSIFPSSIYRGNIPNDTEEESEDEGEETEDRDEETPFKKSIKARMLVTQVFNTVRDNAQFTFDYLVLCVTASLLACLGLVENSSVILVASMLVSPLMGPILGGTFGTVMQNKSLRELGIKNELIGLLICLISGLLFGIISGVVNMDGSKWGSTDSWPTNEMKSRGVLRSLWVGVCIAIPSGAGVALSVLGGNAGSLVGVAISASLLPPAVNAGMLWAYSVISAIRPPDLDVTYVNMTVNNSSYLKEVFTPTDELGCKPFLNNKYSPAHSCNMSVEAAYLGFISLMLTNLNILCIFIMGIAFLKIKQVAPQHTTTDSTRDFWSQDIHVVKESYSTSKGPQSMQLAAQARKLLEEWRKKTGDSAENTLRLRDIIEEVENSPEYNKFLPRIGGGNQYSRYLKKDFENALHQVQEGLVPETRVVEEKTKGGYNVYKTYHGLHPVRRRHRPQVTFNLEGESPTKQDSRPMSDGSPQKSPSKKRFSLNTKPSPLTLNSNLYTRRKSKENSSETPLSRFKVSKVEKEEGQNSDVRDPLLDSEV